MTSGDRLVNCVIAAAVASNFGPYLLGGVRTDHVFLYGATLAVVVLAPWTWLRWRPTPLTTSLIVVWLGYALIGLVGSFGAPTSRFAPGSLLAGLDNLLLPLAVMATVGLLVTPDRRERALEAACRTTVWLTAANGLLAAVSTRVDLSQVLRPFWAGSEQIVGGVTVAERAAQLGRVSGVFNQPAEAGLMYGLAGLAAVYVYRDRPSRMYLALVPIFIGGVLCVSKVFLLVAAPLILWQIWRMARRVVLVLAISVAILSLSQLRLFQEWPGATYLQRLLRPGRTGLIDYYTAGRIGQDSSLLEVVSEVQDRSPLVGFGARGLRVAYDNGWIEALVVAGVFGVITYTLALGVLVLLPRTLSGPERELAWGSALLTVIGSVGVPAFTANRSGAVLWIFVALLAVRQHCRNNVGELVVSVAQPRRPVADEPHGRPLSQRSRGRTIDRL